MVRLLLRDCEFFVQIRVFPLEIEPQRNERLMFGELLERLRRTISFDGKEEFLEECKDLNARRIEIVHRLTTRQSSLERVREAVTDAKEIYDSAFALFDRIHDGFRVMFHDLAKDCELMEDIE